MEAENKPKNPMAFPVVGDSSTQNYLQEGMTLRDYFANSAMQGVISNNDEILRIKQLDGSTNEIIAKISYSMADAMLKQREL